VPGCGRVFQEHKARKDFFTAEPMIGSIRGLHGYSNRNKNNGLLTTDGHGWTRIQGGEKLRHELHEMEYDSKNRNPTSRNPKRGTLTRIARRNTNFFILNTFLTANTRKRGHSLPDAPGVRGHPPTLKLRRTGRSGVSLRCNAKRGRRHELHELTQKAQNLTADFADIADSEN